MKKYISIILSILLMTSCVSFPAFAGDEADELVVNEIGSVFSKTREDTSVTLDGSLTAKWITTGAGNELTLSINADVSAYGILNIQAYSPKATDDAIGIHLASNNGKKADTYSHTIDWEGWKTIEIPLTEYSTADLTVVTNLLFWDYGWNYTYADGVSGSDKNGSLNFGKIWFSKIKEPEIPSEPEEPAKPEIPDSEFDIVSYNSESVYSGKLSMDTENVRYSDASAKWDVSANSAITYDIEDRDFTAYKYINALIYAPMASESVIMFRYGFPESGYASSAIPLNFEGWKIVSIPISSTSIGENTIARIDVYNYGWTNKIVDITHMNIERIWLSLYDVNTLSIVGSTLTEGYNRVSPLDFEVKLSPSAMLDTAVVPEAVLTDSDGNVTNPECEVRGSMLILTFSETLAYGESYKLTVSGIAAQTGPSCDYEVSFSTLDRTVNAKNPVFAEVFDGTYNVMADVSNPTGKAQTAILYVCEYDADGNIVKITTASKEIGASSDASVSADVTPSSKENPIEAFVVSENSMPITAAVTTLADGEAKVAPAIGGDGSLTLDSASYALNVLKASVTLNTDFTAPVTAFVKNADGEAVYAKALMTSADGNASFEIPFSDNELKSGKYTLEISSEKFSCTYEFNYASEADKAVAYDAIKNAGTIAEIEDILKENCSIFNYGTDFIENNKTAEFLAEVIHGNALPESFDEVNKLTDKALGLRDEINSCDWNKLVDMIEENYDLLLCSNFKNAFGKLSSEQKGKVAKLIEENRPYELFSELASDLDEFIDDVKSESSKKNSSGGGGGGSSGGSAFVVPLTPAKSEPVVSESVIPPVSQVPFDDLEDASWAKESVINLYEAGVVSPAADKKFRPDDFVTREEFTKLICTAFSLEDASAVCSFADVQNGEWYYTYIASMNAKGIVTGYGDIFGIGDKITREDMAVIAVRALAYLGKDPGDNASADFTDETDISDYARESVNALFSAGIINGMSDGTFAPQSNATRAQTAKIINGLMQFI